MTTAVPRRKPYGEAAIRPVRTGTSQSSRPSWDCWTRVTGSTRSSGGRQSPSSDRLTTWRRARPIRCRSSRGVGRSRMDRYGEESAEARTTCAGVGLSFTRGLPARWGDGDRFPHRARRRSAGPDRRPDRRPTRRPHRRGMGPAAPGSPTVVEDRVGVVMITFDRREEALRSVGRLLALPERPCVVVVDNGSSDGTAEALRDTYGHDPHLDVVALDHNAGAVGRNLGVARVRAPYVAFCDDDTWWEPGSLAARGGPARRPPAPGGGDRADPRGARRARRTRSSRSCGARPCGAGGRCPGRRSGASSPGPRWCGGPRSSRSAASARGCGSAARRS